ncbi:hypothetical protein LSF60_10565 [Rhodococcus pyridinivorans]|uniref:hypothetical protein n=1 Tax=Rhodococcus pyridinivorans TaxID=103816 RepID=UPI001E3BF0B3|nr:hypothetical protein [Rhodococcus pyridinivorans]UGQ59869.1 hypothetical protein LSF60_10565 [Rhodococcus pyridinivorans]
MTRSFSGRHGFNATCLIDVCSIDDIARVEEDITDGTCPRCWGRLPEPPEYPAGSRVTSCRCIPICGTCGTDESDESLSDGGISDPSLWPIDRDEIDARRAWMLANSRMVVLDIGSMQALDENGVTAVHPRPNPSGWAEFGRDEEVQP